MNRKTLLCVLLVLVSGAANASPFLVDFTYTGFIGPDPTVTGSAVFESASINSPIQSVTSINLTIAGHTYILAEVGSDVLGGSNLIGGLIDGVDTVSANTNDFILEWAYSTNTPDRFIYATASSTVFTSRTSTFSITPVQAAVPEPATLALFSLGAVVMCLGKRRHAARLMAG